MDVFGPGGVKFGRPSAHEVEGGEGSVISYSVEGHDPNSSTDLGDDDSGLEAAGIIIPPLSAAKQRDARDVGTETDLF
jgi:hypothetical protein